LTSPQPEPDSARAPLRAGDGGWPAVIVTDANLAVVHWSRSAAAVYGWSAEEAVGRLVGELVGDPVEDAAAAAIVRQLNAGESWDGTFRVRHRDGTTFVAHVRDTPVFDDDGRLVAIVGLSYPVGEERLPLLVAERGARTSAERATERLRRLQQVTAALSRAMTTDEVIELVLNRGMELEGAGSGSMWLLDEAAGVLRFAGAAGTHPGLDDPRFHRIPLDADLPGSAVVRAQRPLFLRSVAHRDETWPALAGTPTAMEALAVIPLVVNDRSIGCLSFGFAEEREFGEGERDFLAALANVCAQVLDRARLYEAERAASARVAFLAGASHLLNTSLDYDTTLQRVVSLLLEAFATLVVVDLVGPDGSVERVAMGHVDPDKREALEALRGNPIKPGTAGWDVLRTGEPQTVAEVSDAELRVATETEEMYQAALAMDIGPALVVPLTARGRVVGALYLARPRGAAPFTPDDLALATDLGVRAGGAVDNARMYAGRAAIAETLQRSLLPPSLPDVPGLELGARYRPLHAGLEVGGDFYDCYPVGDGWAFMIGDVVGNGPRAAAVTALVRHTARAVAPYVSGPKAVVHAVREALVAGDDDEVFCTLLYGSISRAEDGVRLDVVGAGHPQPYVVRASGELERIATDGGLLGSVPPVGLDPVPVLLAPGDTFVCVTDGVLEARRAPSFGEPVGHAFFDEAGLVEVLRATAGQSADEVAGGIENAVLAFTGGRAPDDVAVLVLRAV
jgi:PAS domain S-box-containing protein